MAMQERIRRRLAELRADFAAGQERLAETEQRAQDLRHTLLRISGAVDVLEELLADEDERDGAHMLEVIDGRVAG
jgi:hypothetical protein